MSEAGPGSTTMEMEQETPVTEADRRSLGHEFEARRPFLVAAVAVGVLSALQLARQPGIHSWETIWAEDGNIFATDALDHSWKTSLFRGYAGYVQVLSRLLALPLRLLPAPLWAAWLALSAALVTSLLALFVYHAMGSFVASRGLRALVAVTTAVSPAMALEANTNIANLGWPLLFAAFWALLYRSTSRAAVLARSTVLVATALTTTLAVLYLPLALLIGWRRRTSRREVSVTGAFVAALIVQILVDDSAHPAGGWPGGDSVELFFVRVVGMAALGERWLGRLWSDFHLGLAVALGAWLAAVCFVVGRKLRPSDRRVPLLAFAASATFFAVPTWLRGLEPLMRLSSAYNSNGSRYLIVPSLLLLSAVVCAVDRAGHRWLRNLLAVQMILVVALSLGLSNLRSNGPPWRATLAATKAACDAQASNAEVHVKTPPVAPHFNVRSTCGRIRS